MLGHNGGPRLITSDAATLAFVQGQAYRINATVYEERFPDWDFSRLAYVDTSGNPWAPGVMTYTSTMTGAADWISGYAKDVPLADVGQDMQMREFHAAAIGYQYNIMEVNAAIQVGGSLPDRRARAARMAYQQFMYTLVLTGEGRIGRANIKGLPGLINYAGVTAVAAASTGSSPPETAWVLNDGTINKTPAEIGLDINNALTAVNTQTNMVEYADTVLLPVEAFNLIASTPYSDTTMETILSWLLRTNVYTATTGRPLTIRAVPALRTAATEGVAGGGRMVVYKNDPNYVKVHLPMPHQFGQVYQDGPMNWTVPGLFRTGGLEFLTTQVVRYVDGILPAP